ncbi:MAG TPA: DUF2079 domain-containing protein [Actinospica sp.]|nr:DUF2079 domain-containing protein [Actinospica sp.]
MTTAETESRAQPQARLARLRLGRLRRRGHRWGVCGIALLIAVLQGALGIQQYRDFYLGAYDLGIFDQAIRNYAHGNMPVSPLKDVHDAAQVIPGYGHVFSILGDHFSPILAVLAPLYWIWNDPVVLLAAQAALFGAAVPSIWLFTRRALRRLAPERTAVTAAYLVALAYGISWPLQMASQAGFHEVAFFTLLSAVAIERLQAGRLRTATPAALALLLVKEDAGYVVAAFGLVLLLIRQVDGVPLESAARRGYRRTGAGLIVAGLGVALAVQEWWLPALGGRPGYYWFYDQFGSNLGSALWKIVSHPVYAFDVATQPGMKVHTFLLLLWPVLFCCLLSPFSLMAVPLIAERAFSDKSEHWGLDQHYNAFLAAILIMAAVDGAARAYRLAGRARARWFPEARRPRRGIGPAYVRTWAGAVLVATIVAGVQWPMPLREVFAPGPWQSTPYITAENEAVAMVPDGACVEADNNLATHLVSRTQVLLLDEVPRGCPWVVLQTATVSYPFSGPGAERIRAQQLAAVGYQLVFSSNEVFVYHRP